MMDLLFVGIGWTDIAITLNRIAVGAFFMLSGYHKLFNVERRRSFVDELKALGVLAVGFNLDLPRFRGEVRIHRRRRRRYRAFGAAGRAWPACHHPRRHRHVRAAANRTLEADR